MNSSSNMDSPDNEVNADSTDEDSSDDNDDEEELSQADQQLFDALYRNEATAVQEAIRNGADVSCVRHVDDGDAGKYTTSPLYEACQKGYDEIVRILLDAGANSRWRDKHRNESAFERACWDGHLSIVEILLNHDKNLLEIADNDGETPLFSAIANRHVDLVRFMMDRGANVHATTYDGTTTLMRACQDEQGLAIVRLLLAAGVDVHARDEDQGTALHHAALWQCVDATRELILERNAKIFAEDNYGRTPFDLGLMNPTISTAFINDFIEIYGNKLTRYYGRLALHAILAEAAYSFATDDDFHPPLNPLEITLEWGELRLEHLRILMHSLGNEVIRNRNYSGNLPIHVACQNNAPVGVLSMLVEIDPATLQMANHEGALPIHVLCSSGTPVKYARVRYLVEQGGVGTLAARNQDGAIPLHLLCGCRNPSIRTVQYLIQSFSGSVAMQTNSGLYPFMIAADETSRASLSIVYELVRANPLLIRL